ncbi:NUDIX domain-containing protein (plasmid) [Paenibacillus thiaminolyticus]|uniref:NUDIX domain-containing protein n=1 Tax=Paenibacillus thiaminolyticus TaxID=49283 RepID=UPI00232F00C5|nr:NUDIX domain-containing protein [Paenibacillus thiaminolyticus]WCF11421.1 NUDIX domain-containing protein [Paenibacillus thiaminolyticus]
MSTIDFWIKEKSLDDILQERDRFEVDDSEWNDWNEIKGKWLEHHKPSTKEEIVYFDELDLLSLSNGFIPCHQLPSIPFKTMSRSLLEYHPRYRHPIPYVILKHKKKYFFILRQGGSGEMRLIGRMGLVGGHVSAEEVCPMLDKTILNGLRRELMEEVGVDDSMIHSIELKGLIKSNEGVDSDHLGLVYEIELENDDIASQEEGVIEGIWLEENELKKYVDRFESWAKIVYENILRERNQI